MAVLEGVCDRTPAVRDALRGEGACTTPTPASLAAVRTLTVSGAGSLRVGDFGGLPGLRTLDLSDNGLGALPAGTFAGLGSLRALDLSDNALATLSEAPFAELSDLRTLLLDGNAFETLSAGLFAGLGDLREASLLGNPGAPFTLAVELTHVDADPQAAGPATVEARIASAVPFALRAALSAEPVPTDPESPVPPVVEIAAGEAVGTRFQASAVPLRLRAGAPAVPTGRCGVAVARLCFRGFKAAPGPALTLFERPMRMLLPEPLEGDAAMHLPLASVVVGRIDSGRARGRRQPGGGAGAGRRGNGGYRAGRHRRGWPDDDDALRDAGGVPLASPPGTRLARHHADAAGQVGTARCSLRISNALPRIGGILTFGNVRERRRPW